MLIKSFTLSTGLNASAFSSTSKNFRDPLTEGELFYLKLINPNCTITISHTDYDNAFKIINRLRDNGHTANIKISITDKNLLNNYIFSNIDKIKYTKDIEVYLVGKTFSLTDYMKYEKKLLDLIMPAINLSPFEKYLFAYNVTKKFKKYNENEENKTSARDLYQIIDNKFMVCVGYSKLLGDLLDKLGIENYVDSVSVDIGLDDIPNENKPLPDFVYDEKKGTMKELETIPAGHFRRKIHLVDPKYGIDGYYFADPTWDNDMEHDAYNHALMTEEEYIALDRYNYYNVSSGIVELFFVHSLEEFYLKINNYLDRKSNKTEVDVVGSLLDEINENNHDASCDLGALYYTGRIGEQNYEKAVYYYEKSAKLGNRQAIENLGYCYYYGRYVEVDYKKAYHYFVKGALDGHLVSLYKIGDMYKNGLYVEKDERQAYYIYRRCSELLTDEQEEIFGADIYIRLADCYYYEVGVEKNLGVSLYCYQKAEQLYYPRIVGGDFAYKKQYERAIKMQRIIREEREKEIPNFDWN